MHNEHQIAIIGGGMGALITYGVLTAAGFPADAIGIYSDASAPTAAFKY